MATRSASVNVIAAAIIKAARTLNRDFGEIEALQSSPKDPGKFAAAAIARAEPTILRELTRARRGHAVITAAGGGDAHADAWLIETVAGAGNFARGLPLFAIVVGLREGGRLIAGTIYDPLRDVLHWAEHGAGAYADRTRLRVSTRAAMRDSLVALALEPASDARLAAWRRVVIAKGAAVRETGCAALDLASLAGGRFDGFCGAGLSQPVAEVGGLIVREAGGLIVRDADGILIAGNATVGQVLADCLDTATAPSSA